ncbi:MAG: hypothetical protein AAGH38_00485 [Pseudomonadota bacterium]
MANVYEGGEGDKRQSDSETLAAGDALFRKRYRQLTDDEVALHDRIKDKAAELAASFYEVAPIHQGHVADREKGANVQLAIRHLEDAVYRAVKALTS